MSHLKECKVTVRAVEDNGKVRFELDPDSKYGHNGGLRFNNEKKDDYYLVTFKLKDDTNRKLKFPEDKDNAIRLEAANRSESSPECPQGSGTVVGVQPLYVTPSRKELVVFNDNDDCQYLSFSLHFVDSETPPTEYTLDPPWENNNGGLR